MAAAGHGSRGLKAIYLRRFLWALQAAIFEKGRRGHIHCVPELQVSGRLTGFAWLTTERFRLSRYPNIDFCLC